MTLALGLAAPMLASLLLAVGSGWLIRVLPPAQEYYFRRAHAEYHNLPDTRPDCAAARDPGKSALALLYPAQAGRLDTLYNNYLTAHGLLADPGLAVGEASAAALHFP